MSPNSPFWLCFDIGLFALIVLPIILLYRRKHRDVMDRYNPPLNIHPVQGLAAELKRIEEYHIEQMRVARIQIQRGFELKKHIERTYPDVTCSVHNEVKGDPIGAFTKLRLCHPSGPCHEHNVYTVSYARDDAALADYLLRVTKTETKQ